MNKKTISFIVVGLVLFAGIFNLAKLKKADAPITTEPIKIFELFVENNKVIAPSVGPLKITEGDNVILRVTTDENDELHLHGYDLSVDLEKDVMGEISFIANTTGRFEFELEKSKTDLGALEVFPK